MKHVQYMADKRAWHWRVIVIADGNTKLSAWGYRRTRKSARSAADHWYATLTDSLRP